jgi:hypothetical protein
MFVVGEENILGVAKVRAVLLENTFLLSCFWAHLKALFLAHRLIYNLYIFGLERSLLGSKFACCLCTNGAHVKSSLIRSRRNGTSTRSETWRADAKKW